MPIQSSKNGGKPNDEIYTPPWLFERLGLTFDLDVAGPLGGLPHLPAKQTYSEVDDGLTAPWFGLVWCNPPYSQLSKWTTRFMEHRNGVALLCVSKSHVNAQLFADADAIVMLPPTSFIRSDGSKHQVFQPVFLAAYGKECVDAIRKVGPCRVLEFAA